MPSSLGIALGSSIGPNTQASAQYRTASPDYFRAMGIQVLRGRVFEEADHGTVAVMCSEYVWWRCHRRLIADVVVLTAGLPVGHVLPSAARRSKLLEKIRKHLDMVCIDLGLLRDLLRIASMVRERMVCLANTNQRV